MTNTLKIREIKKIYKSALCAPCTFHLPILASKLLKECEDIQPATPLEQHRKEQLITKISNMPVFGSTKINNFLNSK